MGENTDRELRDDDRINFKVYDMPTDLVNQYISLAKLDYNNEVWRVLEEAMKLLKKDRTVVDQERFEAMEQRLFELEEEVQALRISLNYSSRDNDDDGIPRTFGDSDENNDGELFEKLEELG